jgi:hypothetical protein
MVVGVFVIETREGLFPNHGSEARQSSKPEVVMGLEDCGSSKNSPYGVGDRNIFLMVKV